MLPDTDGWCEIAKGNALIRANFGINPANLSHNEWAELFSEALWLERFRLSNMAKLFGSEK